MNRTWAVFTWSEPTVPANRYISVLMIADGKVRRWRDYLDPVAVFDAVGWPSH